MGSDFLYWRNLIRSRAYQDWYKAPPVPPDSMAQEYIKLVPTLEALREPYLKLVTSLEAGAERYIKAIGSLEALREVYLKLIVDFLVFERYLKMIAALESKQELFIRLEVAFAFEAVYIKLAANLVKSPPLEDLGAAPPATKTGLISRTWLSVASVKKEV